MTNFRLENVLTTNHLPVTTKHFATNDDISRWPHLDGIRLPEVGGNNPYELDEELEKREPFAVKTRLGWTVYGPVGGCSDEDVHLNCVSKPGQEMVREQLDRIYNTKLADTLVHSKRGFSIEDRKANQLIQDSARLSNGQ